jgi:hypothetical protein
VWLTSRAAILTLASDHCTNLTVWSSLSPDLTNGSAEQPESSVDCATMGEQVQGPAAGQQGAKRKTTTYLSFTISDGDNLQYCQHRLLHLWRDPARGQIPIGWTIAPALQQVMPPLAAYYRRTASANDELIAGPSGAAYVLPISLPKQHRAAFLRLTSDYMKAMQLTLLEVLDRDGWFSMKFRNLPLQKQFCSELADAGLRGILSGAGSHAPGWHQRAGLPIYQNLGLAYKPARTLNLIRRSAARGNRFLNVYIFAWQMTPTDLQEIVQQLGDGFTVVTPGRLLELMQKET